MATKLEEPLESEIERVLQSHYDKDLMAINRLRDEYSAFKKYQELLTLRDDLRLEENRKEVV